MMLLQVGTVLAAVLSVSFSQSYDPVAKCPCNKLDACENQDGGKVNSKEVIVFTRNTTNLSFWGWSSFTALMAPAHFVIENKAQASTMCQAHENKKKFGITVKMDLTKSLNATSEYSMEWIESALKKRLNWHADILNIDLIPYFKEDHHSTAEDHKELVAMLIAVKRGLKKQTSYNVEMTCVVPWKPPCAEASKSCDFSWHVQDVCDAYIINEDSFLDDNGDSCKAGPTIPFSKMFYGLSEYNAHLIPLKSIILGVPWHGYDYTCDTLWIEMSVRRSCVHRRVTTQ